MDLFGAAGQRIGDTKELKISRFLDVKQKVFEGPVECKFYSDRVESTANCYHCRSLIFFTLKLSRGEAMQVDADQQFRKNLFDLCCDGLVEDHQCGLIYDGRDNMNDVFSQLGRK